MNIEICCPIYYQIYCREGTRWYFQSGKSFYNPRQIATDLKSTLVRHDLTKTSLVVELFRINGGKPGYYLANLKDKKYYYCGADWSDVKKKLLDLGIGRADPLEK